MSHDSGPITRSQSKADVVVEDDNNSSSDSESLENTMVGVPELNAANTTNELLTPLPNTSSCLSTTLPLYSTPATASALKPVTSSSVLPPSPFAAESVFSSLMSTMTSLKSAIDDLRHDTARNNNEIVNLRSKMVEHTHESLPRHKTLQSTPFTYEGMPPSSCGYQDHPKHMLQFMPSNMHQLQQPTTFNLPTPSIAMPSNIQQTTTTSMAVLSNTRPQQLQFDSNMRQVPSLSGVVPTTLRQVPTTTNFMSSASQNWMSTSGFAPYTNNIQVPTSTNVMPSTSQNWTSTSDFVPYENNNNTQIPITTNLPVRNSEFLTKLYYLPQFDGKPEDWPLFLATYNATTIEYGYSNRHNLMRLQKALHGPARESVLSMMIYPGNVPQIIDELQFNFGRPTLLIKSQMEKIRSYPAITEGRLDGVLGLATCARNVVAFFKSAKCENHLVNPTLLEQLVLKLPLSKQFEWAKFSVSILPYPTVEDFANWVGEVARFCSLMPHRSNVATNDRPQSTRRVLHTTENQSGRVECHQCEGNHELITCQQFKDLATNTKWEQVKRFRVCFACLRKGHNLTQCKKKKICATNGCSRYHHPMLHQDISTKSTASNPEHPGHVLQCHQNQSTCQLFKILPVKLYGPNGIVTVYALLDEGSSVSLLEDNVATSLGLKGQKSTITLQWYDNMRKTETSKKVNVEISAINKNSQKYVIRNLHTVNQLSLPMQSFSKDNFEYLKHLPIEDYTDKKPSMLIGLDNCFLGLAEQIVEASPHLPVASATKLGWVVYGPTQGVVNSIARICHIKDDTTLREVHKLVEDYFSVENFGVKASDTVLESDDNIRARNILQNSTREIGGRYETGLLWRSDNTILPDSFEMAKQRLVKVENKMSKNPLYAASYKGEINKYIDKGYAKLLTPIESGPYDNGRVWYLPHFGVTNPHKPEKLRIVFDAAATSSNVSLNSTLLKGPEHAKSLQTILFQFRQGQIAIAGDIEEMFSQVSIIGADQDSQRFLWRDGDTNSEIRTYVMKSMIFGAICSPCCAEYVKNFNAGRFKSTMPRGATAIIDHTYVDDLVISFNTQKEALEVVNEAIIINAAAGFKLRRFSSNCAELENNLNNGDNGKSSTLNMERQSQTDKILGLYWNKITDRFEFHVKFHKISEDVLNGKRSPTKREILGIVMAIFDPFGFLANFTVFSKLLLQKTWKLCLQWDEKLPQHVLSQWNTWWKEFERVKQFSIPRCYTALLACADEIQLHIFVDASSSAYAAVAYLRVKCGDEIQIAFVVAKSRCAPPKGMTIPRLELQAAVLGCRLKTCIEKSHEFKIHSTIFWSDSKTVVLWIRSTEREYKQFVACRIAEILSTSQSDEWRWLPTELNVADDATRAKLSVAFDFNSRWLTGPEFLKQNEEFWPTEQNFTGTNHCHEEEKVNTILILNSAVGSILNFERFSNFLKMKRHAAWVLRFIDIYMRKSKVISTELTSSEIEAGEMLICRQVQMEVFGEERSCLTNGKILLKSSNIYQLKPYMDDNMLLRVYGRIDDAYCLPDTARRPIIMPTKHAVTTMIVNHYHRKGHHQNDHVVINEVRQKFWVPHIRSVLKSVKKKCNTCIRDSAMPIPPLMGQLPIDRLTPYVRPFSYVGLDYCGPFYVAIGRSREKRWIALFTCLSTRALHLEISTDLSTDSFLICMRNFVNRRGVPVRIRSDNGTNFIGAQKEMIAENRFWDFDEIQRNLSKDNIDWIFNCPANPHAGGCWERLVRCVKRLLYKVFKEEAPRLETFRSAMIEAECIINNRPLTELPIDPDSEEPLTPNHFLIGGISSTQTPGPDDEKVCLRKQWRIAQNLKDRLWKRWIVEYLPQLLMRPKWRDEVPALKPEDVVLILEDNQPRSQWKTGRVTKVFMGKDGHVRSAEVRTSCGLIRRPAVRLAVLNLSESSA